MSHYTSVDELELFPHSLSEVPKKDICCEKPFPSMNVTTGITKCISCGKKYRIRHVDIYDCNNCGLENEESLAPLDLLKNGKTNWVSCRRCHKLCEYRDGVFVEFINK